ncbi:MAG: hypothetical protein GY725_17750 [bacterium]|nr:hypothetical protein [bacterium]
MRFLRLALPWAIGVGIFFVLFWRIDAAETLAALKAGDLLRYAPIACGFIALWLAIDAYILHWLFSRIAGPLSFVEMVRMRAETYPVMVVSFDLASAALVAAICRRTGSPVTRVAGGMLVHYLGDLAAVTGLAFTASVFVDSPLIAGLRPLLAVLFIGFSAVLLAGRLGRGVLRGRPVVESLSELSVSEVARLIGSRVIFQASFAGFVWLTLPSFGLEVSALDAAARMPIVLSIGALPITPGGLGTTQAAISGFFGEFGDPAKVLAYGLVYGFTLIALRLPLGLGVWLLSGRLESR